ncbi:DUF2252 domain-containing protein [Jiangella alba]|uniref:Uncharacterized conserved protein, DUF2252 family n=1 Tax=Jiangella alba TaxID=561176 RepID=A0A1H5PT84_9ACTN|nr:DUF2252 domain-containing protein [Jiangella alba]SEF16919.1 Uncharacterized conserved protein, DUF2252 family [Jiangella alba]
MSISTVQESRAAGKDLRATLARSAHAAATVAAPAERDPVAILVAQHASRLADLTPVRIGRMLQSPFAYYRGTAAVMAHDLAGGPHTGVEVVSCGDAHVSNFGLFASPERRLLFDLNDFDEAGNAPWEWDVKRLATSVYVGGRDLGMSEPACADATEAAVRGYREALLRLYELSALERYYYQVDADQLAGLTAAGNRAVVRKTVKKARSRTSEQVLAKIVTTEADGRRRIVDQPPITRHVDHATVEQLQLLFERYRATLRQDVALLLSQFRLDDYVLRVVGVGSVGTRCYVLMFTGPHDEPLFLQAKEAQPSVLATYGGLPDALPDGVPANGEPHTQGHRVVAAQRILQAQSDPFLGWITGWAGEAADRPRVDYYWRQFRDMKGSVDLAALTPSQFTEYGVLCGGLLARAHSQSPGGAVIRGYLGRSDAFDRAVARWSRSYADQCEADFAALDAAVTSGRVAAEHGI